MNAHMVPRSSFWMASLKMEGRATRRRGRDSIIASNDCKAERSIEAILSYRLGRTRNVKQSFGSCVILKGHATIRKPHQSPSIWNLEYSGN